MKKIIFIILIIVFSLPLVACGPEYGDTRVVQMANGEYVIQEHAYYTWLEIHPRGPGLSRFKSKDEACKVWEKIYGVNLVEKKVECN